MDLVFLSLLAIHVLAMTAWVGFAMFFEFVVESHKRQAILSHVGFRLVKYLTLASTITIVAGAALFAYEYFTGGASAFGNGGLALEAGSVLGIIAWLLGIYLGLASSKLQKAGAPPSSATIKKLEWISRTELAFLIVTIVLMVFGSNM